MLFINRCGLGRLGFAACKRRLRAIHGWAMALNVSEPVGMRRHATVDAIEEQRLQTAGDRPAATGADLAVVEFANRRYFSGSSSEKSFICTIDLVAGDPLLDHRQTQFTGQLDHRRAGDALKA